MVFTERDKNSFCLRRRLEEMLQRSLPEPFIVEEFERRASARADRAAKLCRAIVSMAAGRGIEVRMYAKGEVQGCHASVGALTRHEIAEAVVRHIDALRNKLPKKVRPWEEGDRRMAIFAAAALSLTPPPPGHAPSELLDGLSPSTQRSCERWLVRVQIER